MKSKKIIVLTIILVVIIIGILSLLLITKNNNSKEDDINNIKNINNYNESGKDNTIKQEDDDKYDVAKSREKAFKQKNNSNKSNKLNMPATTEDAIMRAYLEDYKYNALNFPYDAYNSLDKEYRDTRFSNVDNYKEYVDNNKEMIQSIELKKYAKYDKNNYKEYVLVDNDDRYYIFHITAPGQYKLYLDTYTIDLSEFTEKYNKANDQEKVVLNMGKVITAINNQDYRYIYSKLAGSFKNNYFDSEDSLKEFLQKNIYRKNQIEFDDFEREGNIYTYKVRIVKQYEDGEEVPEGKNAPYRKFNIVMQLKEGTDFVMSFSIDE